MDNAGHPLHIQLLRSVGNSCEEIQQFILDVPQLGKWHVLEADLKARRPVLNDVITHLEHEKAHVTPSNFLLNKICLN